MIALSTLGIRVSVETTYQPSYSSPIQHHYVFTYHIKIENGSEFAVQLLRRYWRILDAGHFVREIDGDGVIGLQPIIESGQFHQYTSGCNLKSGMGKMSGTYRMLRLSDHQEFDVVIPEFSLVAPWLLN